MSWNGSTYQFLAEDGYQRAMGSMSETVNEVANQRDTAKAALKKSESVYREVLNDLEEAHERLNAFAEQLSISTETVISLKTENFELKEEVEDLKEDQEIQKRVKRRLVEETKEQAETIKELQRLLGVHALYLNKISFQKKLNAFIASNADDTKRVLEELKSN